MSTIVKELVAARQAEGLTHEALAQRAGLSRMTVQRTEAGKIDPRLSTLLVMARALGMDLMLVPTALRPALLDFAKSGGRMLGQPAGLGAPPSLVDTLLQPQAAGPAAGPEAGPAAPTPAGKRSAPKAKP